LCKLCHDLEHDTYQVKTEDENYWSLCILEPDNALNLFFLQKSEIIEKETEC